MVNATTSEDNGSETGMMKRAVKWTLMDMDMSTVDQLEKCSLVDVDQEKGSVVDVNC